MTTLNFVLCLNYTDIEPWPKPSAVYSGHASFFN